VQAVKPNNVVKCLIAFDTSIVAAGALIAPVFAIFVVNNIVGGSAAVVGFATSIYMVSFSIARLTSAYYVDKKLSEKERVALSVVGTLVVGTSFLLYVVASRPWHVYALQALNGIGTALRYSPIMSLFTRYIDKGRESFEWGLYAVSTSLGQAFAASVGGALVDELGFEAVFAITGGAIMVSSLTSLALYREIKRATLASQVL
jgi:MFS family permease